MTKLEEAIKEIFNIMQDHIAIFELNNNYYIGIQAEYDSKFYEITKDTYEELMRVIYDKT